MSGDATPLEAAKLERPPPLTNKDQAGHGTFGRIVLDLQLMTQDQLNEALKIQRERQKMGDFARLGHILVDQGFLTPDQVQQVLQAQKIVILTCEACASQYNIRGYSEKFRYECPKCHAELKSTDGLKSVAVQDQLEVESADDTVRLTRPEESNTARIRILRRLGRYEILGEIARGGMGIIYKARQLDLDRIVALKTLRQEEVGKPEAAKQFRHEAQAVAGLRHPNIVAVHEVGNHEGIEYFTMEFVEGLPLDRMLMRNPMTPVEAVRYILPIAEALNYAHSKGVVHRDLKPANIIVDLEDGKPFLVDFGIAQHVALEGPRKMYDDEEDLLGSIPYMAPEYVEGSAYDELCDLYSLGVVLYEALAGPNALPYYDDDTRKFLEDIVRGIPKPITSWVPELDLRLVTVVNSMIAPRDARYVTVADAARELRRWLDKAEPEAPADEADTKRQPLETSGSPEPVTKPAPKPRIQPATIVVGAIAGLALAGLTWTVKELSQIRGELENQKVHSTEESEKQSARLRGIRFKHAQRMSELGQAEEALSICNDIVAKAENPSAPDLADVYELRGKLRKRLGKPGADEDLEKAEALRK